MSLFLQDARTSEKTENRQSRLSPVYTMQCANVSLPAEAARRDFLRPKRLPPSPGEKENPSLCGFSTVAGEGLFYANDWMLLICVRKRFRL